VRKLRIAFSKKEKGEELLARLKELKKAGEVDDEQYQRKSEQYTQLIDEGTQELEAIRGALSAKLEALEKDLEENPAELKELELKHKLGEIDAEAFSTREQKLRAKIAHLEEQVKETKTLLDAKSAEAVGGAVDVQLEKKPLLRRPKWLKLPK
jgi:outer membrane murein-binding lipoprotein Lpp